jgi:hypothetical protein
LQAFKLQRSAKSSSVAAAFSPAVFFFSTSWTWKWRRSISEESIKGRGFTIGIVCRSVFFASLSLLSYEVTLIRVFSIRFSYHYASLVISIAMIGLVMGGIYRYLREKGALPPHTMGFADVHRPLFFRVLALALAYPAVFVLAWAIPADPHRMFWENSQIPYLFLLILSFAVPFFVYGEIIAWALSAFAPKAHAVYACDLGGAAAGALLSVFLLNLFSLEMVITMSPAILSMVILFESGRGPFFRLAALLPLLLSIPIVAGPFEVPISQYKGLTQALKEEGAAPVQSISTSHSRLDVFENKRMRLAPGLSLAFQGPVPKGLGMALDGDIAGVMTKDQDDGGSEYMLFLPSSLPFLLKRADRVLVVGVRNSLDVTLPHRLLAHSIYAAEVDLSVARFLRSYYGRESLLRRTVYQTSGRKMAELLGKEMDVVMISRTGFTPSGSFGLQEDYEVTVDALRGYLLTLRKDGYLFIQFYLVPPPRYELRMMVNLVGALEGSGIERVGEHIVVFRTWDTINFLSKMSPFTEKEREKIRKFLFTRQFEQVYPPQGRSTGFITGTDYGGLLSSLVDRSARKKMSNDYPFDIRPTTDDRPFFHYFLSLAHLQEIYRLSGRKWVYFLVEGMALPFILVFLVLLSAAIFIVTFLASRRLERKSVPSGSTRIPLYSLFYFAGIGFAFMCLEVFFIHTLVLSLGSTASSFSVSIMALLLSSGYGSLLSGKTTGKGFALVMWALPLLLVVYALLPESHFGSLVTAFLIVPPGVLAGFFFPLGLQRFFGRAPWQIPLAYATNGSASIIAAPLASMIAVVQGLRSLLWFSCLLYLLSLFLLSLSRHGNKPHAP